MSIPPSSCDYEVLDGIGTADCDSSILCKGFHHCILPYENDNYRMLVVNAGIYRLLYIEKMLTRSDIGWIYGGQTFGSALTNHVPYFFNNCSYGSVGEFGRLWWPIIDNTDAFLGEVSRRKYGSEMQTFLCHRKLCISEVGPRVYIREHISDYPDPLLKLARD